VHLNVRLHSHDSPDSLTMDSIINFLGANPYQAIAVPVIGGLASGTLPPSGSLLIYSRLLWPRPPHNPHLVRHPPKTTLQPPQLDLPPRLDNSLHHNGLLLPSRRPNRTGNPLRTNTPFSETCARDLCSPVGCEFSLDAIVFWREESEEWVVGFGSVGGVGGGDGMGILEG